VLFVRVKLDETTGRLSLDAPSTPYHELDLSDSFLAALHSAPWEPKKKTFSLQKRRLWFLVGGLLGILGGYAIPRYCVLSNRTPLTSATVRTAGYSLKETR